VSAEGIVPFTGVNASGSKVQLFFHEFKNLALRIKIFPKPGLPDVQVIHICGSA
jgi:hypothetical protein